MPTIENKFIAKGQVEAEREANSQLHMLSESVQKDLKKLGGQWELLQKALEQGEANHEDVMAAMGKMIESQELLPMRERAALAQEFDALFSDYLPLSKKVADDFQQLSAQSRRLDPQALSSKEKGVIDQWVEELKKIKKQIDAKGGKHAVFKRREVFDIINQAWRNKSLSSPQAQEGFREAFQELFSEHSTLVVQVERYFQFMVEEDQKQVIQVQGKEFDAAFLNRHRERKVEKRWGEWHQEHLHEKKVEKFEQKQQERDRERQNAQPVHQLVGQVLSTDPTNIAVASSASSKPHHYERMWTVMSKRTQIMLDNVNSFLDMAEAKNKRAAELNEKLQVFRKWKAQAEADNVGITQPHQVEWLKKNGFWPKSGGNDYLYKGDLEVIVQNITTSVQTLGQEGELNLIKLQSSLNSFQQTQELLSNFVKKMADLMSSIIRNVT